MKDGIKMLNIDRLKGGRPVLAVGAEDVIRHLENNPVDFNNKRIREMFVGWLIAQFFSKNERSRLMIMLPLVQGSEERFLGKTVAIEDVKKFENNIIDDREIDVLLGSDQIYIGLQITRYFKHPNSPRIKRLSDLIKHKCARYKPDEKVSLVITLETQPEITEKELREVLDLKCNPFKAIFLIQKESMQLGRFRAIQIYPNLKKTKVIDTGLAI